MNVAAKVRTELGVRLAVGNCNIKYPIRPKPTPEMTYSQPYEPAQPSQAGRQEAIREQEAAQQKAQAAEKKREEDAYRAEIALREQLRAERVAKQAKAERERKAHPVCVIKQAMTNAEIEICKNER